MSQHLQGIELALHELTRVNAREAPAAAQVHMNRAVVALCEARKNIEAELKELRVEVESTRKQAIDDLVAYVDHAIENAISLAKFHVDESRCRLLATSAIKDTMVAFNLKDRRREYDAWFAKADKALADAEATIAEIASREETS